MFEWFKRKESSIEIIAKKDEVSLLTAFNEKFKEYKDILTSFSKQDTQTFKDIEEIVKSLEKYLDAVKDIKQLKEYERLIKVYDKKLEKAKVALETLNDIDVAPKKQQKAEQQVAEVLGEEPEEVKVETKQEETLPDQSNTEENKAKDSDPLENVASLKEKLLKKNATDNGINLSEQTITDPKKSEEVAEILNDNNKSKEQKEQELKSKGLSTEGSYNMFLKQCFGSEEKNIDDLNEEFKKQIEELKNSL